MQSLVCASTRLLRRSHRSLLHIRLFPPLPRLPLPSPRIAAAGGLALLGGSALSSALCDSPLSSPLLSQADQLFEANHYEPLVTLLRSELRGEGGGEGSGGEVMEGGRRAEGAALLWRLARGLKKLSDSQPSAGREALLREAMGCAERAVSLEPTCGQAHKWYAIVLSQVGEFGSTSDKIKNSFRVREHFELAVQHSPSDATSRHLLGLWCFEVAKLSWIEKKAAAALFASPPTATYDEAIGHLLEAERMEPNFYPKNQLVLSQAYAKIGDKRSSKQWLQRCLAATPQTPEDYETLKEAAKLNA